MEDIDIYKKNLAELTERFKSDKKKMQYEYGMQQAIFKPGNIICDNRNNEIMQVEKITVYVGISEIPEPVYYGIFLNKKSLTPKKIRQTGGIYGNHNVKLIKES